MAINAQTLEGNWNQVKGKLREKWSNLSQDDLQAARGNVEQLIGLIEKKTGEARKTIEQYINDAVGDGASGVNRVLSAARDYASAALENADDTKEKAAEALRTGFRQTERVIQHRPMESLAVGFGAGLITGVIVGLVLRR